MIRPYNPIAAIAVAATDGLGTLAVDGGDEQDGITLNLDHSMSGVGGTAISVLTAYRVPPAPWEYTVRPNSPPQITSVSSRSPRCFRSVIRP